MDIIFYSSPWLSDVKGIVAPFKCYFTHILLIGFWIQAVGTFSGPHSEFHEWKEFHTTDKYGGHVLHCHPGVRKHAEVQFDWNR